MDFLELLTTLGFFLLVFAGFFVATSFMGGFAGAIAAGGRENRSLLYNFVIGLAGAVIGSGFWAAVNGEWPEEMDAGVLLSSFVASIVVALLVNWYERRKAEKPGPGSATSGASA
jgi:uncharacterized membrane protein YeaQ/YmgE (transglycosylase-associated protein family)